MTQKVYIRIKGTWYCMEYPPFDGTAQVHKPEQMIVRAQAMLGLHEAAERVFYIQPRHSSGCAVDYIVIKTDGVYEFPEPDKLYNMTGYLPEDLCNFLNVIPKETLNAN